MAAASSLFTTSYGRAATAAAFPSVGLSALNARNTAIKSCSFPVACLKNHSSNLHAPYIRFKSTFIIFLRLFSNAIPYILPQSEGSCNQTKYFLRKLNFFVFFYCKLIYLCYYTYKENKNVVKMYSNNKNHEGGFHHDRRTEMDGQSCSGI